MYGNIAHDVKLTRQILFIFNKTSLFFKKYITKCNVNYVNKNIILAFYFHENDLFNILHKTRKREIYC